MWGAGDVPAEVECHTVCSTSGDRGSGTWAGAVAVLQVCPQGRCAASPDGWEGLGGRCQPEV